MTTYIIYSDTSDGYIMSRDPSYALARMGTGQEKTPVVGDQYIRTGQNIGGGLWHIYESFFSFDTSVIVDTEEIVDANLSVYVGWPYSGHAVEWGQQFHVTTWTAPLTGTQWKNPTTLGTPAANFDWNRNPTPFVRRATGGDNLINSISKTAATKLMGISNLTVGGWNYVPTETYIEGGETTNKPYLVVYTVALDTLNVVERALTTLSDGTTISLRSDGASNPTITVGYQPLGGTRTFISNLSSSFNKTIDGYNPLDVVSDHQDNFYIIGAGNTAGQVVGQAFVKTSSTSWTAMTPLTQSIPEGNGQMIRSISGSWLGGTGPNDPYFLRAIVARGASGAAINNQSHVPGAGWTQDISFNPENLKAGSGAALFNAANHYWSPSWAATGVPVFVDTARMNANYLAVYIQRAKFNNQNVGSLSVFRNEGTHGVGVEWNTDYVDTGASKLLSIDSSKFAHVYDAGGRNLVIAFYNNTAKFLGSASIPAELFQGGVIGRQWAAHYDAVAGLVRVHYINTTAGTRALDRVDVSATTFAKTTTANVTTTLGASGSTNVALRVSANSDERRVTIDAANSAAGVLSTQTFFSLSGNYAPTAPVMGTRDNFDAALPAIFTWTFSDANPKDTQSGYQIEISRVSDSVVVHDTGKVTSSNQSHTLAANTLTNGVNYRWRVRTYDTIGATGTYSGYVTFTTSATGTTTITSPATDNALGIETSSYTVVWNYSGTQAQRRVRLIRTLDSAVILDTTMQASTANNYTLTNLVSGTEYRIEVTIVNSGSLTVPMATRRITSTFSEPMTPSAVITVQDSYIDILTVNPSPTGDRPEAFYNDIYKRENKPLALDSDFVRIGTVNNNGTYRDYAVRSAKIYDYKIVARTS